MSFTTVEDGLQIWLDVIGVDKKATGSGNEGTEALGFTQIEGIAALHERDIQWCRYYGIVSAVQSAWEELR